MDLKHKVAAITALVCWGLAIIVGIIIHFTVGATWTLSFFLGFLTGLMTMGISIRGASRVAKKALDEDEDDVHPVKTNALYFLLRILLLVAIFAMVIFNQFVSNPDNPKFNVWASLIGYGMTKVVLIVVMLIMKGEVKESE